MIAMKQLKFLLFLALCATAVPKTLAETVSGSCGGSLSYTLDVETGALTISGIGEMSSYLSDTDVPWYTNRLVIRTVSICEGVTSIGYGAFLGCSNLISVTLPESVTSIGWHAFYKCNSLVSINIPYGITSIGSWTFYDCSNLVSITFPESVTSIYGNAFKNCSNLSSINIPKGVSLIGDAAFEGCSNLLTAGPIHSGCNIEFGWESEIPAYAFSKCSSLISVNVPESVTSIGRCAFFGCSNLTSITLPEGVISIGSSAFCGCSSLSTMDIPEDITIIESQTFSGCSSLASIILPEGVTSIGELAFCGCSSLASINIPEGVTSIGDLAFCDCSRLASINIPEGVSSIGTMTFYGCSNLSTIVLPSSVQTIGQQAFEGTTNLQTISLPNTLTSIGKNAFKNSGLGSIVIPNGIKKIEESTFEDCINLSSVTLPASIESVGMDAFSGCSTIAVLTVPDCVDITNIWQGFRNVRIDKIVVDIEDWETNNGISIYGYLLNEEDVIYSYRYNDVYISGVLKIPAGTKKIGKNKLCECKSISGIVLPESVQSVENSAFYNCSSLTDIYFNSNPSVGGFAIPTATKRHLSLSEAADFNNSNANTYADATYERVLADGKYGTIIFPFAIDDDTKSNYEFYELDGQEGGRLNFTVVDDPQPGTPYLYKNAEGKKADCFTSGGSVTICTTVSDKDAGDGWTMKGNYESLVITDADELDVTYYLSNNKVMNATTSLTLKPFRAYFQGPSYASTFADAGVKSIAIRTGEGTTLVSPETMEEVPAIYYDLSGRAVANPQSGIYIVNGKKLMVK